MGAFMCGQSMSVERVVGRWILIRIRWWCVVNFCCFLLKKLCVIGRNGNKVKTFLEKINEKTTN